MSRCRHVHGHQSPLKKNAGLSNLTRKENIFAETNSKLIRHTVALQCWRNKHPRIAARVEVRPGACRCTTQSSHAPHLASRSRFQPPRLRAASAFAIQQATPNNASAKRSRQAALRPPSSRCCVRSNSRVDGRAQQNQLQKARHVDPHCFKLQ